jgi:hypothetical protein
MERLKQCENHSLDNRVCDHIHYHRITGIKYGQFERTVPSL